MHRPKPHVPCAMPENSNEPVKILILNASLKHGPDTSNTQEVAELVLKAMEKHGPIEAESIRLADKDIPVGLGFKESDTDEWPAIVEQIKKADVIIFATPIWWGGRSSLMQRIIERLDALDEEYLASGRSALLNKVAGVVITGSEDGAQSVLGGILEVLTFMNFTIPPQACAYWVGEVGEDPKTDSERRRKNKATPHMAENVAQSLMYYAKLLKKYPMEPK